MASEKVETIVAGNYIEMERDVGGDGRDHGDQPGGDAASSGARGGGGGKKLALSSLFWHGGSVYDAWFSCASNQVAQVLLTLPYSFSQLGMASGVVFQIFYGLMGSWTAYLISVLYVEYRTRKEREKVDFRNHVIQVISCIFLRTTENVQHVQVEEFLHQLMLLRFLFSESSGLRFLMGYWGSTGGTSASSSTALSSSSAPSSSSSHVQGNHPSHPCVHHNDQIKSISKVVY